MMNSGVVGAVALLAVGGALYLGSTYLGDYFADRNAATQQAAVEETAESSDALALVPDSAESALEDAAEAVAETAESAVDAVTETAESAVDAVTDMAESAADAVTETVTETADAVSEAVDEATEDMAETMPEEMAETAMLTDEAAQEVLENLGSDRPETASEPGTTPVLDVVRVEPSGEVLIAGNAPQGERVGLVYNNEIVAEAEVTEGGDFVLVPEEALPAGEGTLEVVVIDQDGNRETQSDEQVALVLPEEGNEAGFLVGVLRPGEPVEIIEREAPEADTGETEVATRTEPATATDETADASEMADATPAETVATAEVETAARTEPEATVEADAVSPFVVVDAIELEGQEIWIAGASVPGTVIRLYQDNELLGETTTGEQGRYLFEGTLRDATGEVTVRADALATGSADVIARAEVPFEMPGVEMAAAEPVESPAEMADSPGETATETVADIANDVANSASDVAEIATETAGNAANNAVDAGQSSDSEPATETASNVSSDEAPAATPVTEIDDQVASAEPTISNERVSVLDTGRVIIRRGDNLWRLSRRVFGRGIRYTSIYDANRDQIRNPALIFPGQVFDLPTPQEEWGEVPGVEALEPDQIPGPDVVQN
jgi:nucleoid-associated protein YgaU/gas vesicle protein